MRVAVTGGRGFLGRHIVAELKSSGHEVISLVRTLSNDPSVSEVLGDLVNWNETLRFPGKADALIHAAALYAEGDDALSRLMEVNVEGTRRMLEAAAGANVRRFVHVSTMGTCAPSPRGKPANEKDRPISLSPYARSKLEAEKLVLTETRFEVVIMNPAALVGAGDHRPSVTGSRIQDVLAGRYPRLPKGPVNHVPVRAAARTIVRALTLGKVKERYLLGGQNLEPGEFLREVALAADVPIPKATLRDAVRRLLAPQTNLSIDDHKARLALGHDPMDLRTAFKEAVLDFRSR